MALVDSNHHSQIQSLLSCHWTKGQYPKSKREAGGGERKAGNAPLPASRLPYTVLVTTTVPCFLPSIIVASSRSPSLR